MQVYVTVFADGPTRVLRFSDDPSTVNVDTEQSILDLAARLKQVSYFHFRWRGVSANFLLEVFPVF